MIYRFRVILDTKDDVFRDIEIDESSTLEDLHNSIIKIFGFLGNEMASFYKTDDNWGQGDELPLTEFGPENPAMNEKKLNTLFDSENHKLLLVYDFLNLWTFFIELMEIGKVKFGVSYPNLINAQGEIPEEAPEKKFKNNSDTINDSNNEENYY